MKKLFSIVLCLLIITSCTLSEPIQTFNEAFNKTIDVNVGQQSIQIEVKNTFNKEKMDVEDLEDLEEIEKLYFEMFTKYDFRDNNAMIESYNYFDMGKMGFDSEFYKDGTQNILKFPMFDKYIVFDDSEFDISSYDEESFDYYIDIFQPIVMLWVELLEDENVFKGDKTILTTEDGDVKATQYTITPTDEQTKTFLLNSLDIIEENIDSILTMASEDSGVQLPVSEEEVIDNINSFREYINELTFEVKAISYIDMDGFVIDTNIDIKILYPEDSTLLSNEVNIRIKNWDNWKEQSFNIPIITDDNSIKTTEIDDLMIDEGEF